MVGKLLRAAARDDFLDYQRGRLQGQNAKKETAADFAQRKGHGHIARMLD
ncbi:MAG: hypothetical protein AB1556_17215 [Bacillota bacterium]